MFDNFFQFGPLPANIMEGSYDIRLVILSYIVAVFASYIALDITGRLRDISNTPTSIMMWLCGGSLAMGAGIWSMHFIGMLAFKMPMPMTYDPYWTALSMLVAIGASGFALFLLRPRIIHLTQRLLGGVVLGMAIAAMHYTGMAAMTNNMSIHYLPGLFFLSIIIAILASEAALWLALKSTEVLPQVRFRLKFVSAFIMGAAICGMHYTGMAAAVFTHNPNMMTMEGGLNPEIMSISIATVTFIILGIAFIVSTYKESLNQQLLLTAHQAGMAEVAASVLHNVGNVLNSVGVSSNVVLEKIHHSKLEGLQKLSDLINENKENLSSFVKEDPRGQCLPDFVKSLATYWQSEQASLKSELTIISKNIGHIKNIIATQQDFSRTTGFNQQISIQDTVEEAILICGIENPQYGITIKRKYISLKPVIIDKVKLLQVLVNLIKNAKEALIESKNLDKHVSFIIKKDAEYIIIEVSDNGLGVAKENLTKIFTFGFTTKKNGHGFGLHVSAISAKEMGGQLKVESEGVGKGAAFILCIPER